MTRTEPKMFEATYPKEKRRIGEIAIVGPKGSAKQPFIQSICQDVHITDQDIIFGSLKISSDLYLFLYGIGTNGRAYDFAWDLVAQKILGYIVLFDWYDEQSFKRSKQLLDFITFRFDAPVIIAADVRDRPYPVNEKIYRPNISLTAKDRLTFCKSDDSKSTKRVVISLLDTLIAQLP